MPGPGSYGQGKRYAPLCGHARTPTGPLRDLTGHLGFANPFAKPSSCAMAAVHPRAFG